MARADPVLAAFTENHVQHLTGLTKRQLRYWHDTGFFMPSAPAAAYGRYYAFRDVVGLRTIAELMKTHRVSLQHLRKVAEKLDHMRADLWTRTTLYVINRKVVIHEPGTRKPREVVSGQYVLGIPLKRVQAEARAEAEKLLRRAHGDAGKIVRLPGVAGRAPVMAGTRIPVTAILRFTAEGFTPTQIVAEYPDLTVADVEAALLHGQKDVAAA